MSTSESAERSPSFGRLRRTAAAAILATFMSLVLAGTTQAATAVGLGTAGSYGVLGGAGVTNTGPSVINGNLGTAPNPSVTGFGGAPNGTVNGAIHKADAAAMQAQDDLTTAYNDAAGQGPATTLATELGNQSLSPGVYNSSSGTFGITGPLTLNAGGDPDAVFIFKTASTLITAAHQTSTSSTGHRRATSSGRWAPRRRSALDLISPATFSRCSRYR